MKKLFYFGLVIGFFILAGCGKSNKDKLIGLWKLKSMEGRTLSKEQLDNATITFDNDGKVTATAGKDKMEGTWNVGKDEKTVNIRFGKNSDDEVWNIQSLSDKEFVYKLADQKQTVTLEK